MNLLINARDVMPDGTYSCNLPVILARIVGILGARDYGQFILGS